MSAETVDQSKLDVSNYETNNQTNSASNGYDEPKTGQTELQEPFVAKMSEDENINTSHDGPIEASIESKAFTESDVVPISTEFVSVGEIVEGIMNKVEVSMNIGESENEVDPIVGAVDGMNIKQIPKTRNQITYCRSCCPQGRQTLKRKK